MSGGNAKYWSCATAELPPLPDCAFSSRIRGPLRGQQTVKQRRAPLHAAIVVANPNAHHLVFGGSAIPDVDTRLIQPADLRREINRLRADVLVVEGAVPDFADHIAFARSMVQALPILFVAERLADVTTAMAAGATDFATASATATELGIRIQLLASAVVRPLPQLRPIGAMTFERESRLLSLGAKSVALSPIEAKMFERFLLEPGRPVPRTELERSIWGQTEATERVTNVAVVYVSYLRRKLARLGDACVIRTITNVGYAMEIRDPLPKRARPRTRL